ncbi:nucleotidyltransferase domain-containing protein [Neobacillus sp. OS1-32]|uniref:nucleotidyltransferase domain-containing protein n=1 Tax=Neobacillus sp. OS1-32 TaxID=3070682 RepID=UPI0027E02E6B|nr:nucleotidyltransferase domain-containing protein [Neobacillus sp. OS1-32]WML28845.1 nucleotidyltransferase domain-containing protein [Neobacillus sp. OS1-32]
MKETILKALKKIESDYNVKILYACEAGSRAWGVSSKDSDYDVRFIYVHKKDDYLTIDPIGIGKKRDVIELPIDDLLDITGWELTKALRLLRKSNPPLLEWLHSGIVYYQEFSTIAQMKKLTREIFAPQACLHHYLNMANKNFQGILQDGEVSSKRYLNVLRPILVANWIEKLNEFPPLDYQLLLEKCIAEGEVKGEIKALLKRKRVGEKQAEKLQIDIINEFFIEEISRLRERTKTLNVHLQDFSPQLDSLFRNTLDEVWA